MASKVAGTIGLVVVGLWVLPFTAMAGSDSSLRWSATSEMRFTDVRDPANEDFRTGFLDKYQFSADKHNRLPLEIALSRVALDWFGDSETPRVQFRFRSPSSDLSFSGDGPSTGEFFLNQRGDLFARFPGLAADLVFRRSRVDELRLFTNPTGVGSAIFSSFNDGTNGLRRFFVRRERVGGEIHLRPCDLLCDRPKGWLSELNLRGSWEDRSGRRQLRFMLGGGDLISGGAATSRWRAVEQDLDQQSVKLGSSLVFSPGGLFTLELAFDHERFRNRSGPFLQSQLTASDANIDSAGNVLGLGAGSAGKQTVGFIPETSRSTGTARFQTRLGGRIAIHGGFQLSQLKQIGKLSPLQDLAGLDRNNIFFYSGNLAANAKITQRASVNAFVRFDNRRNRIDRSTALFNSRDTSTNTQFDPFLAGVRNIDTGAEVVLRPVRAIRFTLGSRAHFTNRSLDFLDKPLSNEGILPSVTVIDDDTVSYTVYVKSNLRPVSGLHLSTELGLSESPKTGYIRELSDVRYGKGRASYTLPLARPVTLSAFGNGERGENNDFKMLGESPGNVKDRGFDQVRYSYGITLSGSPSDEVSLFGSFFQSRDAQDFNLVRATIPRMDGRDPSVVDLNFFVDAPLEFRTDQTNLVVGGHAQLTRRATANVFYSFTRSKSRFDSINATSATLASASRIRSDIQSIGTGLGFHLRDGADLSLGYRYDAYHDRAGVNGSAGSAAPFRLSTGRHFVTLGVTLTDEFFGGKPKSTASRARGRRYTLR